MHKRVILMILDGWGIGSNDEVSAIKAARTPFIDSLYARYASSKLEASGLAVGLPEGQMGNSEVGHMNIGAGRVVYQDLVRLNKAAEDGSLAKNETLAAAFHYAKASSRAVHFMGLVSDGGIHAHSRHLKAMCTAARDQGVERVFVHAFTDGRDTDPKSGRGHLADLQAHLTAAAGTIASVTGRYYAMDRDKRWERVRIAYDAMVNGAGETAADIQAAVQASYDAGITDEFIKPIVQADAEGNPVGKIAAGDVVVCFNFRSDRGRQITEALSQHDIPEAGMRKLDLYYVTMTTYDERFKGIRVMYRKDNLNNTLAEVLADSGKKQIRIAETEKYPHVTFFFSGGREETFEGERRLLCPSPKAATYDLEPAMSAEHIRSTIIAELRKQDADFVCLNFANPDMVGHTGVFEAAVRACETVDNCTRAVVSAALDNGYSPMIIADHGNSDIMINPDGSPNTAHTTNPVPCIFVDHNFAGQIKDGKLGDIAPTILSLMGLDIPKEMTGSVLVAETRKS